MRAAFEGELPLADEADPMRGPAHPVDVELWRAARRARFAGRTDPWRAAGAAPAGRWAYP
jgi:hypothetical protein